MDCPASTWSVRGGACAGRAAQEGVGHQRIKLDVALASPLSLALDVWGASAWIHSRKGVVAGRGVTGTTERVGTSGATFAKVADGRRR